MQIKATIGDSFVSVRIPTIFLIVSKILFSHKITNVGRGKEKLEPLCTDAASVDTTW